MTQADAQTVGLTIICMLVISPFALGIITGVWIARLRLRERLMDWIANLKGE